MDIFSRGDNTRYFKPNHDVFLNPYQVVFVPKPNQSTITALTEERTAKFTRNKREVGTFELLCVFAERQLADIYFGDWVDL